MRGYDSRMQMEGVLIVTILRGVKLADRELFGKQDPYVVLSLTDSIGSSLCRFPWVPCLHSQALYFLCSGVKFGTVRTATVDRGGRNPVWTSAHNNVLTLPFNTTVGSALSMEVVVWDEDNLKAHDHIGACPRCHPQNLTVYGSLSMVGRDSWVL